MSRVIISEKDLPVKIILENNGRDVRIREKNIVKAIPKTGKSKRGSIKEYSIKSQQNSRFRFRAIASQMKSAITLTYPLEVKEELDGIEIKRHLAVFIKRLKRKIPDLKYAWVLEFQKNENPHFHLLTNYYEVEHWHEDMIDVADTWYKIVDSKLLKHRDAGTDYKRIKSIKSVGDYMASYLNKQEQKRVPENFHNVGRFWGMSRGLYSPVCTEYHFQDNYDGIHQARAFTRDIRRYRKAKLRELSKKNDKKYRFKNRTGGFIIWGGSEAVRQLLEYPKNKPNISNPLRGI